MSHMRTLQWIDSLSARRWPCRRCFHDYFVTHLPSSSLHGKAPTAGPSHELPHGHSTPHDRAVGEGNASRKPVAFHHASKVSVTHSREETIVRIPLRKAKHHFGAICSRGTRSYNEDSFQAGTVEVPAFARKPPVSLTDRSRASSRQLGEAAGEGAGRGTAENQSSSNLDDEDPQVFYFAVFDGHGGDQCSRFLTDKLHLYLEDAAAKFCMRSSLVDFTAGHGRGSFSSNRGPTTEKKAPSKNDDSTVKEENTAGLAKGVVKIWKETVGGYFRRFQPEFFARSSGGRGEILVPSVIGDGRLDNATNASTGSDSVGSSSAGIEQVLTYTHLRADLDFVTQQVNSSSMDEPPTSADDLDSDLCLGRHSHHSSSPFLGGSTSSTILISTPTSIPFWHPDTPLTLVTAHVGDTRILICDSVTGAAVPLTTNHHPSTPAESARLRRYAAAFTTDSFGEERFAAGLANTRAFGDVRSKRVGVSAEPEIKLLNLKPAECSFLVLMSDGVAGVLSDQEVADVVKESRTPEEGAKAVAGLAEELAVGERGDSDNVTCLVVRLGGWERRAEGGGGSLGTKEGREWRRREANDPRRGRT